MWIGLWRREEGAVEGMLLAGALERRGWGCGEERWEAVERSGGSLSRGEAGAVERWEMCAGMGGARSCNGGVPLVTLVEVPRFPRSAWWYSADICGEGHARAFMGWVTVTVTLTVTVTARRVTGCVGGF